MRGEKVDSYLPEQSCSACFIRPTAQSGVVFRRPLRTISGGNGISAAGKQADCVVLDQAVKRGVAAVTRQVNPLCSLSGVFPSTQRLSSRAAADSPPPDVLTAKLRVSAELRVEQAAVPVRLTAVRSPDGGVKPPSSSKVP
ncbi:hypothetical protein OJAV_G00117110 [Oryzias javanicus]|uniref:Uncharacterized protein n=1 Tax=Oryzias javanicus TaxID=123683 RepID=A0A437CSA5_ORYJA|nr:hypothetical protein OJAV_G00117110 [Oryzias javanicus]